MASSAAQAQAPGEGRAIVTVLPTSDVLDTLAAAPPVDAVVLDPWYNRGVGGERDDYHDWLAAVIEESCRLDDHVFVWGFSEILARQVTRIPEGFDLLAWLTWFTRTVRRSFEVGVRRRTPASTSRPGTRRSTRSIS